MSEEGREAGRDECSITTLPHSPIISPHWRESTTYLSYCSGCYLGIYAVFGFSQAGFVLLSTFALAMASFFASRTLHNKMLDNVLQTPMSFFDTTPLGRILNRFSKDVDTIDVAIPQALQEFLETLFSIFSIVIAVSIVLPTFLLVIVPMAIFYFLVQVSHTPYPCQLYLAIPGHRSCPDLRCANEVKASITH